MVRVVVIDTGLDLNNPKFNGIYGDGISFELCEGDIAITKNAQDEVGHGTAISNIIISKCNTVKIIPIKVIGINYYTEERVLIESLKYVLEFIECDVINMSLGLNTCTRSKELKKLSEDLQKKGVIIVSAFNNDGSMSYPAMLDTVIGVDSVAKSTSVDYYEFIENSEINIRAMGGNQRVLWLAGQYKIVCGSSFAAAHVSAIICNFINSGIEKNRILDVLRERASKVISSEKASQLKLDFDIKKAIVFPYNKEIHSVVKFDNNLIFELLGVYDVKESGNVGKKAIANTGKEYIVCNLFKIDWNGEFDTIIVGHINVLQRMLNFDLRKYLILKCKLYGKNMYSFDYITSNLLKDGMKVFCPYINESMLPKNTYGKLYYIDKPVLGVFGTGSKQGKFTLQMILKEYFECDGYQLGYMGTEPSALLFGGQKVYPMGYENSVDVKGFDSISLLNKYMFDIAETAEVIIVGSQSNTVPPLMGNQYYYTTKQIEYLLGTQPDAVLLCFNAHDDKEYVSRTIYAIENIIETKVIAMIMFPLKLCDGWLGINGVMEKITDSDMLNYEKYFLDKHNIPMFYLDDKENLKTLYTLCINYFAE